MLKTKPDKTIPLIIIGYGLIFILPAILSPSLGILTLSGIFWCCIGSVFVLSGLWKIEFYELVGSKLIKYNFFGLFKKTVDLTTLVHYNTKLVNGELASNPLNVVRFFSKKVKYLRYRKVVLKFEYSSKIILDERTISNSDFNKLLNKIKGTKSRVSE